MDKAERIAIDLMTGGMDVDRASSLKLYRKDGMYLGAWSLRGLADRIRKHLNGELDAIEKKLLELNESDLADGDG